MALSKMSYSFIANMVFPKAEVRACMQAYTETIPFYLEDFLSLFPSV